ncbi:MAG: F-type H+-transporting ATPase subunit delta [Verrucomicrobia bacterium]|nr:MAG: F-type H+-transporting ATPase subunit delta [Verrucomicrobiota bacterium]
MKISKEAQRMARQLLRSSFVDDRLDEGRVRLLTGRVIAAKPRAYLQILSAYANLLRLELGKSHARVETAVELQPATRQLVEADLRAKSGRELTFEYVVNPDLLGGMRVKVGSDVWDGSIRSRLQRLQEAFR